MIRKTITLTKQHYEKMDRICKETGITFSDAIRRAIESYTAVVIKKGINYIELPDNIKLKQSK
jgi:predicted CopG family antitoxin